MTTVHKFTTTTRVDLTAEQREEIGPLMGPGKRHIDGTPESITIIDHWHADGKHMLRQTLAAETFIGVRRADGDLEMVSDGAFGYETRVRILDVAIDTPRPTRAKVKFS